MAEAESAGTLGWYIHIPYCSTRCGYCDFNTYTAAELGAGVTQRDWAATARAEVRLARRVLGNAELTADTVFFGGGTPTLLPAADLVSVLRAIDEEFGLAAGAEITVEANPDTVTPELMDELAVGGVNRVSLGMQSADPGVLRVLERTHDPGGVAHAASVVRAAAIGRLSVDLIYGTPGETAESWRDTVSAALELGPDHVSAYCLGIEEGTRLGARVRAGLLPEVDQDAAADRYEAADELFRAAGLRWYEISNWSLPGEESRHNLRYWRGGHWWGVGPGAHSHVGGVRWWNVRHPRAWTAALVADRSPAQAREVLSAQERAEEAVMLRLRLAEGLSIAALPGGASRAESWQAAGHAVLTPDGRVRLTRSGRLIADALVLDSLVG